MKRLLPVMLLLAAGCGMSESTQKMEEEVQLKPRPPRKMDDRPIIAIMAFDNKTPNGQLTGMAGDVAITGFTNSKQVAVVERATLDKVLQEMKLQHSGVTEQSDAVEVGRHANAKYVLVGAITNYGEKEIKTNVSVFQHGKENVIQVVVDLRFIEVKRNVVVAAKSGMGQASLGASRTIVGGTTVSFDPGLAGKALRSAIYKMIDEILDEIE